MDDILALGVASVCRYCVEKTGDVPFGFLSTIYVEKVTAVGCRTIPLRVKLEAIEQNVTFSAWFAGTLDLERKGLELIRNCLSRAAEVSAIPDTVQLHLCY